MTLKSAYKPRTPQTQWTKDVETSVSQFVRISATYDTQTCQVELSAESCNIEEIAIATKWDTEEDDGYVGIGYTKRGIYVSHHECHASLGSHS